MQFDTTNLIKHVTVTRHWRGTVVVVVGIRDQVHIVTIVTNNCQMTRLNPPTCSSSLCRLGDTLYQPSVPSRPRRDNQVSPHLVAIIGSNRGSHLLSYDYLSFLPAVPHHLATALSHESRLTWGHSHSGRGLTGRRTEAPGLKTDVTSCDQDLAATVINRLN